MKFIDVTESGTNFIKSVSADKIKTLQPLTYRNGQTVTVIIFTDDTELHVTETVGYIKQILA